MAGNVNHTDSAETTRSGGTRKRRSLEKLPNSTRRTEERGPGLEAVPESATGGLAATWSTSQAAVERGAPLLPGWLRRLGHYGLALLFVAAVAVLRWALSDALSPTPFLIFYLAWVGAAVFGGLGPGLLATVASWVCVEFLFDSTPGQVGFTDPMSVVRLIILLAGGLAVSLVGEKMRRSRIHERRLRRKLAELAQSLEREKGILQSVMSGAKNSHLVYLDRDFNFVRVNETYARTCGYTPEEMVGKNHFALYPDAENEAIFSRVRDTGVPVEVHDKPFVFPDQPERGTTYWDWTLTPIKNGSGYVEGLVFSLFETTQRKQAEEALRSANDRLQQQAEELQTQTEELQARAEELTTANRELHNSEQALRESEERYRKFFTDDLAGDFIATADGRIVECNPAFADIYGLSSAAEAVRYNLRSFNSRDWTDLMARLKEECVIRMHQCIHRRPDGQEIHVVANVVGHFDEAAELTVIKGYVYDDTERKRAEEALRERMKELGCLYAVNRDIQEDISIDELCRRAVERLVPAMQFPEITAAVIELNGKRFASKNYAEGLSHGLHAAIRVEDEILGHLRVYYAQERPFIIPEEQNLVNGVAEALSTWLERTRAEEALHAKQAELELIFNRTPFMLTRCTRDLHYRYVSRAYAEMIGRTPDQVAGKPILEIMGEEGFETIRPHVEAVLRGQPVEYEAPVHYQGIGPRFVHVAYVPDEDEQGHVIGWIASIIDITERKRAEEALRESEEKYRSIVETATEGIAVADANARIVFANDRWSEIHGYRLEEAGPVTLFDLVFPEDMAAMKDRWESRKRGVKESYEFRFRRKDGSPVWVLVGVAPRFDPEGKFLGTLVMAGDITERKQAEEALRDSEERYRSLFENMLDGYAYCQILLDDQGRPADLVYLNVNDAFNKLTGLKDVVGKKITEVIPGIRESHPEVLEVYGRVAMTGRPERFVIELKPLGIWLAVSVYSPREGHFTAIFENITERKQAEEALRELNATLESRVARRTAELQDRAKQLQKLTLDLSEAESRERKRLAEVLHDDLQQVLAAAKFHLGLVSNRSKDDETLQEMTGQVEKLLVEAIDKSRRLSRELSPPGLARSDLRETFEWLAGQVQAKHGLTVYVDVRDQIELQSEPLKALLYKAAQEMLFNVVKHAQVREARLRLRRRRGNICLAVSDKGRGFDPQGPDSTAGSGLPGIRERVNLLGGCLKVRSAKGRGSTFLVVVPDSARQTNQTDHA